MSLTYAVIMRGVALVPVISLFAVLRGALAINCYNCQSVLDVRCLDPFQAHEYIVNCDYVEPPEVVYGEKATFCRKIIQNGNLDRNIR